MHFNTLPTSKLVHLLLLSAVPHKLPSSGSSVCTLGPPWAFDSLSRHIFLSFFLFFNYRFLVMYFREGKGGRKRGRETSMYDCLSCAPCWGPGLQPRHVPWPGIEPVTLWFAGQHSILWATPAWAHISIFRLVPKNCLEFLFSIVSGHICSTLIKSVYSEVILFKFIFFVLKYGLAPSNSISVGFRQTSVSSAGRSNPNLHHFTVGNSNNLLPGLPPLTYSTQSKRTFLLRCYSEQQ